MVLLFTLYPALTTQMQHTCSSSSRTHAAAGQHSAVHGSFCSSSSRPRRQSRVLVRTYAQAEKRVARITVAGPPSQPARVIEVDDPQVSNGSASVAEATVLHTGLLNHAGLCLHLLTDFRMCYSPMTGMQHINRATWWTDTLQCLVAAKCATRICSRWYVHCFCVLINYDL